jgi:hypothetical protein
MNKFTNLKEGIHPLTTLALTRDHTTEIIFR